MALRMQQDYHTIGDPGRYSLRILRHGEKNCFQTYNLDVSKINCKEDFLHCIGLQRKKSQCKYKMINSGRKMKRINIPNNVILRDCSIVILGVVCELCGKCFKCETDLNVHISLKHQIYEEIHSINIKRTQWAKNEIKVCKKFPKSFNNTTIESTKNFTTNEHKMLCLTLKIGEEVIAKKLMKRKHLKKAFDDMEIQIESGRKMELIADKNMHGSTVSCIDPVVFNSRCQCCNPSVHAVQCSNRYLASNIVASEQMVREKIIAREKIDASNRLEESCAIPENKTAGDVTVHGAPKTPFELNVSFVTENCNIHEVSDSKKSNLKDATSTSSSDTLMLNEPCHKPQFAAASNTILNCDKKSDSITSLPSGTYTQPVNINPENIIEHKKQENNTNQKDFTLNKMETYTSKKLEDDSKTIHLILPLIMPIVVPNASISSSPVKVTIRATSTEQRKQPQQGEQLQLREEQQLPGNQEQSQLEQQQKQQQQKQITKDSTIEDNSDDDIQEVLRIVRRSDEIINQESPTRLEREMLVQVAIRDMKRMEELGLHLLEKVIDCTKKMKRSKPNGKSSDTNDDCAKEKKKRIITESNGGCRNQTKEKHTLGMKEHVVKVQSFNSVATMGVSDSVKENLMTYNIDIAEMIRRYGANYYNEVSKIYNNAQSVQEPVSSRFLVPSSGGMENSSNGPIVIDLVNGADE
ncbi:hypothetical protein K0M31_017099 [Melipona bicolor]|uniref:C2H2-type domain-containing protein n=1 Tax=Melipona bicolor TaxID=60889 RepID=A0AA40FDE1_9HYME|nr:hypothetical protein K0M31_017099 [Melipona bicolor]